MLEGLIELVADLNSVGLALVAFALAFGETAVGLDVIVPGEAGVVVVGAAADSGGHPLAAIAAAAAFGAMAGDTVSFVIGRRWGDSLLRRWSWTRRRVLPKVEDAAGWVDRHGGLAVFAGRWIGALRAVVPLVAGMSDMPVRRFLAWNVLASITWATTVATIGYVVGLPAARFVDRTGVWFYLGIAVVVAAVLARRRWRR
ncbi:MAG: DedA family protein [Acidimicrobiales bacterium]|nr:DedA family protein [Acidimicrobiales bacterium]